MVLAADAPDYESVIVVDFDNTICPFREDFLCTELVPGTIEALTKLQNAGYKIVISSARNNVVFGGMGGEGHRQMAVFLDTWGIPYDKIDTGMTGKPVAFRYVDDKGVGCPVTDKGMVDWPGVVALILTS